METRWFKEISQFSLTCVDGNDVWFVGENYSLIFQMSLKDSSITRIIRIKDEEFEVFRRYWRLEKVGSKLILIPHNSDKIVIFHLDKNEFTFIQLKRALVNCLSCVKEENILYLIDDFEILVADMENEKIVEYICIPQYGRSTSEVALLIDGHIIIPLIFQSGVIDFNIAERSFMYFPLKGEINGFVTGVVDEKDIWLAGDRGSIVKWDYLTKESTFYDKSPEGFASFNYAKNGEFVPWGSGWVQGVSFQYWYECVLLDNKVWFIPLLSNSLLYIDKKSNTLQKYTFENEDETEETVYKHRLSKFLLVGVYEKRYIKIYSTKRHIIYRIDVMKLEHAEESIDIENVDTSVVEDEYWDHLGRKATQGGVVEKSDISILDLIALVNGKDVENHEDRSNKIIGSCIYEMVSR